MAHDALGGRESPLIPDTRRRCAQVTRLRAKCRVSDRCPNCEARFRLTMSHEDGLFFFFFWIQIACLCTQISPKYLHENRIPYASSTQTLQQDPFGISPASRSYRRLFNPLGCGPFEGDRVRARFSRDGDLCVSARNLVGVECSRAIICQETINKLIIKSVSKSFCDFHIMLDRIFYLPRRYRK